MSITVNFELKKDSVIEGVDEDVFGPFLLEVAKGDDILRRRVTLSPTAWKTLDYGEGTPWLWAMVNIGETNNIEVGFGSTIDIVLEPQGAPAIWTGSRVPVARGNSTLLYMVVVII